MRSVSRHAAYAVLVAVLAAHPDLATAGDLMLELSGPGAAGVSLVGAVRRWDADGNPRNPVDPKARIDAPRLDAEARDEGGGRWVFAAMPEGRYDLVILTRERARVEGFHYPPVAEFEPFLDPDAKPPDDDDRDAILKDIARSRHYENKVVPLFLVGDAKQARVLMQLVRDQPTSYDAEYGTPVATVRHEVWQFTNHYGGWVKDRSTRVLDRALLPRSELRRWTWVWEPKLGGVVIRKGKTRDRLAYELPGRFDPRSSRGWFPD